MKNNFLIYSNKRFVVHFTIFFLIMCMLTSSLVGSSNFIYAQIGNFGSFTGSNYKYVKDSESFQFTEFTLAHWYKISPDIKLPSFLVSDGGFGSEAPGENVNVGSWINSDGHIQGGFESSNGTNYVVTSKNKQNDDLWHYLVLTYDGSILKLFIDGKLDDSKITNNAKPDTGYNDNIILGANSLFLDRLFEGSLDEIRIWDRPLTTAEIHDAFTQNKFNIDGQIVYVSFGDNRSCKQEHPIDVISIGNVKEHLDENAIDNNLFTRWSNHGLGSWIQLDLGEEKEICDIDITWYKGDQREMKFILSVSSNGEIFHDIYTGMSSGKTDEPEKYDIPDVKARYLKITVTGNSMNDWVSISEIDVNNPLLPGSPSPCPELEIDPSNLLSLGSLDDRPVEDAIDNNLSTRWSNHGLGSWIQLDLGQEKEICDIGLAWYKGDERHMDFIISSSLDGTSFNQIYSGKSSGTSTDSEIYDIPDVKARYLKITVTGNSMNDWASISEIDVFGKDVQQELQSNPSQIKIQTQVINNNNGTKNPNDFSININGNDPDPSKIIGSSDIQSITIKPGNYTISVDDALGYKLLMSSGCSGVISEYSIKECVLTLDDQPVDTAKVKLNNILSSTSNSTNNLTKSENIDMNNMTSNNLTKSENIDMNNMTSNNLTKSENIDMNNMTS
ncbi:MAG: discoidin domain-containing protein, partial [Nitrososphaeraceae archaeon]